MANSKKFVVKNGLKAQNIEFVDNLDSASTTITAEISAGDLSIDGNIAITGTVDGRDLAADGTKLDGIEAGAEVNPTASEILTAIKTVDGSTSGLDADLLDGQEGSYYLNYNNFSNTPTIPTSGVDFDPVGTDNSTDVSLSGSYNYLTIAGQVITLGQVDASTDISGLSTVATTGAYSDLSGAPTGLSSFTNDTNYLDSETVQGVINSAYIQANQISNFVDSAYVNSQISALVDAAPTTLDTLNELAAALGDDPNFATTVTNSIGTKANSSITISAGTGLTGGGDLTSNRTISHSDTSSQASVNNSNGTVIQDVTLDGFGHVTGLASVDLDGRYYTETEADTNFVSSVNDDNVDGKLTFNDTTTHIDGVAAKWGTSGDLEIVHDLGDTYITNLTGLLQINSVGGVRIQHNGSAKLDTSTTGVSVTGNVVVSGTVDGRDVAADGTKLDGIEAGATADQTASEILTAIKTVDGSTSGLDADLLDGQEGSYYYPASNPSGYTTNTGTVTSITAGSYLTGGTITTSGTIAVDATTTNTASKVVARDASGNFAAGTITATLSGNATTATTWATGRTISLTGDVTGTSGTFNGSANLSFSTNIAANVVGANELNVSGNGTAGQALLSDGDGSFSWGDAGGGGITFTKKTTTYTASAGEGIIADTSGGAWTLTLPATPSTGDQVIVADGASWAVNNLTVARNGQTIESVADDYLLDVSGAQVQFVYDGTTWQVYSNPGVVHSNDSLIIYDSSGTPLKTIYSA